MPLVPRFEYLFVSPLARSVVAVVVATDVLGVLAYKIEKYQEYFHFQCEITRHCSYTIDNFFFWEVLWVYVL